MNLLAVKFRLLKTLTLKLRLIALLFLLVSPPALAETISTRINPPLGFERVSTPENSFGAYLQDLLLKPKGAEVVYFNGQIKQRSFHEAVIDIDVGSRDLQQCADAVMRLRAEYLFKNKDFDKLHFNFTNGFKADYTAWKNGARLGIKGNKTWWKLGAAKYDDSYDAFRRYLDLVFTYAGTISLANELAEKSLDTIEIGDVFIQPGSPGHAMLVVDLAKKDDQVAILLAQSYMPAQSIHIVKNPLNPNQSPWYIVGDTAQLVTPDWVFNWTDLKGFSD